MVTNFNKATITTVTVIEIIITDYGRFKNLLEPRVANLYYQNTGYSC